jgi:hypothetical protein
VSIPYGAFVENVEADRDFERFTYLGELYQCPHKLLASATDPHAWKAQLAPAAESAAPVASTAAPTPAAPRLQWEPLDSSLARAAGQGAGRMAHRSRFWRGPRVLSGPGPRVGRDVAGVTKQAAYLQKNQSIR